ncbi:MAG: DMT family transporter [Candidatus Pelethousia sp.]|nr:DMT family transporter [Candidatus Pelethousia sp.]
MIYSIICLLNGAVIAVMVAINGVLSGQYGVYPAAVIIHIVGVLFGLGVLTLRKERVWPAQKLPLWLFTGGMIGVLTTVANNIAFGKISMTAIVALGLFGQTVASLAVDCFGLFGMEKQSLRLSTAVCLLFSMAGIILMLAGADSSATFALLLSIASGISLVVSRLVNSRLATHSSAMQSSFINHLMGLPICLFVLFLLGGAELSAMPAFAAVPWWAYLGGMLGVVVVLLSCIAVPNVSSFQLSLLTFVGQVFAGFLLDVLLHKGYSQKTFIGGLLVATGICANIILERIWKKKKSI